CERVRAEGNFHDNLHSNKGGNTMLGELISETSGKLTGMRRLPSEGGQVKVEASAQGSGKLLGQDVTVIGTYWQTVRPDGTLYGEGGALLLTADGGIASFAGAGVGKPTGPGFKTSYAVYGRMESAPPSMARLTTVAIAGEYEIEEDGSFTFLLWEWKGK